MILLVVLFFLTLALIAFIFASDGGPKEKQGVKAQIQLDNKPAIGQDSEAAKLTAKLRKVKEDYARLEEELINAKKNEASSSEEIAKLKKGIEKDSSWEENTKNEIYELKDKLLKKDQDYEKEFSLNLNLKKELSAYKQKSESLESVNKEYVTNIMLLEAQVKACKEELSKQNQLIAELKKKSEDSQWVAKKEYDELKARLKEMGDGRKTDTA